MKSLRIALLGLGLGLAGCAAPYYAVPGLYGDETRAFAQAVAGLRGAISTLEVETRRDVLAAASLDMRDRIARGASTVALPEGCRQGLAAPEGPGGIDFDCTPVELPRGRTPAPPLAGMMPTEALGRAQAATAAFDYYAQDLVALSEADDVAEVAALQRATCGVLRDMVGLLPVAAGVTIDPSCEVSSGGVEAARRQALTRVMQAADREAVPALAVFLGSTLDATARVRIAANLRLAQSYERRLGAFARRAGQPGDAGAVAIRDYSEAFDGYLATAAVLERHALLRSPAPAQATDGQITSQTVTVAGSSHRVTNRIAASLLDAHRHLTRAVAAGDDQSAETAIALSGFLGRITLLREGVAATQAD